MTWDPNEPRIPAGGAAGGQWGTPGKAPAKKKTAATSTKKTTKASAPKLGKARSADAAKVQQDKQAQKLYEQAMGMEASQRGVFLKKLPPDQLEKLTAILYSFPTSDRSVVAARIAVANEMTKRGIDIKKYGALGGGLTSRSPGARRTASHKVLVAVAAKRKAASGVSAAAARAAAQGAATARATSQVHSTFSVRAQ